MSERFTPEQCKNFIDYERVRRGGRWNMFSPQALAATGMTREEYHFVMTNYSDLQEAVEVKGGRPSAV